jgi:hypothetical protein
MARSRYNFLYHYREAYADHDSNERHANQITSDLRCVDGLFEDVRRMLQSKFANTLALVSLANPTDFNAIVWKAAGLPNNPEVFSDITVNISTESELSTFNFNLFNED